MKGKFQKSGKEREIKGEENKNKPNLYKIKENLDAWVAVTLITKGINIFKRTSMIQSSCFFVCLVLYPKRFWEEPKHFSSKDRKEDKINKATSWYCSR